MNDSKVHNLPSPPHAKGWRAGMQQVHILHSPSWRIWIPCPRPPFTPQSSILWSVRKPFTNTKVQSDLLRSILIPMRDNYFPQKWRFFTSASSIWIWSWGVESKKASKIISYHHFSRWWIKGRKETSKLGRQDWFKLIEKYIKGWKNSKLEWDIKGSGKGTSFILQCVLLFH